MACRNVGWRKGTSKRFKNYLQFKPEYSQTMSDLSPGGFGILFIALSVLIWVYVINFNTGMF